MYRQEKRENSELVLLGSAVLIVLSSLASVVYLYIGAVNDNTIVLAKQPVVVSSANPAVSTQAMATAPATEVVLGAKTEQSCYSEQTYKERIVAVRPDLLVYVGTTPHEYKMAEMLSCAVVTQLPAKDKNQCSKLRVEFTEGCVLDAVQKTAFFEPQETITSPDKTRSIEVRIADGTVDKVLLAKKIETELTAHFDYDTMVSPYLTRKQVTMEAPTTNRVPNTTGNYASRYIEVDGSRQLLYIWEAGKYKTYGISGAFAEYNPVGIHSILNKSPNAWSSTANKWMPYWMAFTYDKSQKAWLGFHALVYWYPGYKKEGIQKIYEPETNIGKPRSTGCIRMTKTNSKALYGWARVGDLVIIHD